MKELECKICKIKFECAMGTPAEGNGICHLCFTGIRNDLFAIRGQITMIEGHDNIKNQMIKSIDLIELKLTRDVPPNKKPQWVNRNLRSKSTPASIQTQSYTDNEEIENYAEDATNILFEDETPVKKKKQTILHLICKDNRGKERYSCNFAITPNPKKTTTKVAEVTCQNCLRGLRK